MLATVRHDEWPLLRMPQLTTTSLHSQEQTAATARCRWSAEVIDGGTDADVAMSSSVWVPDLWFTESGTGGIRTLSYEDARALPPPTIPVSSDVGNGVGMHLRAAGF